MCEICGKESQNLSFSKIEGAVFKVCKECSTYGDKIVVSSPKKENFSHKDSRSLKKEEEILVEEYYKIISSARQRKNLKQEDIANNLNEKLSVIKSVESGKMMPTLKLARKLEQFLDIKLIEK